ncbi:hypothetical protein EVAR_85469_1 [Eumeta japonica]|uniref:Uncharacterized protein n=1 Tax=Eumeta variegata TaxID=151549 RepID=A0A4C1VD63_EUMVA|nr:hypothetical protein EVAR_85469_1 [Eumeta japonica]
MAGNTYSEQSSVAQLLFLNFSSTKSRSTLVFTSGKKECNSLPSNALFQRSYQAWTVVSDVSLRSAPTFPNFWLSTSPAYTNSKSAGSTPASTGHACDLTDLYASVNKIKAGLCVLDNALRAMCNRALWNDIDAA